MVTTSTQHSPRTVSEQLNEDNEKQALFKERSLISFLSTPLSRTSYHAKIDWVIYRINLFISVPVKFQQKNNFSLNNLIDPQITLLFGARTQYDKWYLYCRFSVFLCWKYIQTWKNLIISNKYEN